MRRLLSLVAAFAVMGTLAAGAYVVASPGGEEEAVQQVETATPSVSPEPSASPTPTVPPLPTLSPLPTLPAIPSDWGTYSDPTVGFTIRYPQDWYVAPEGHRIASWDLATWTNSQFPPGGVLVDFDRIPLQQAEPRPAGATDTTLSGWPGWETSGPRVDNDGDATWAKLHAMAADRNGYRYALGGAFAEIDADETIFLLIVSSFRFTD